MKKYKNLQIVRHDDPNIPGFETWTLIIDGKATKKGYYKSGQILMQFWAKTIGEAEENCEYVFNLLKREQNDNL